MKRLPILSLPLLLAALACNLGGRTATATPIPVGPTATSPAADVPTATTVPSSATETTAAPTTVPEVTNSPEPEAEVNLLAYVSGGQLLVTNVAGGVLGGTTQYTTAGVDDQVIDPVWSPSGEYVAYTSRAGSDPHLFYVFAAGAGTPVDLGPGSDAAWSPDSTRLAYYREGNLWLTPIDNPAPSQMTFQDNWAWGTPTFTPDGAALIVAGTTFDNMGASGNTEFFLSTAPLDGSGTLTQLPGMTEPVFGRLPRDLRFSPDGQRLAFSTSFHSSACLSPGDHYMASADGSNLTTVVSPSLKPALNSASGEAGLQIVSFAWTPAGDALAITGGVFDCSAILTGGEPQFIAGPQLSIVGLDGTERLIIPGFYYGPTFDRAGAMLAAELIGNPDPSHLHLFSTNGDMLLDLGEAGEAEFQP